MKRKTECPEKGEANTLDSMTSVFETTSDRHEYQPLDPTTQQIRLLRVKRTAETLISCETVVSDLRKAPRYSALSYTWGAPAPTNEILVDATLFCVRTNLFRFLEAFAEAQSEYLWIDQICINQQDELERNHQVGLMSRIYSQSASVIVWLSGNEGSYAEDARDYNATGSIHSLVPLLRNAYWRRLWIVQEVLLAPHVRVFTDGNVWIAWENMCDSLRNISTEYLKMRNVVPSAKSLLARSCRNNALLPDLSWCVLNFSGNDCEEPRDKVYGLMGLVDEKRRLVADYRKSTYSVFLDAVTAVPSEYHNEVALLLGRVMGIAQDDVDSLRYFLAFTIPPQVRSFTDSSTDTSTNSSNEWPRFVTAVNFEVGINSNWRERRSVDFDRYEDTWSDEGTYFPDNFGYLDDFPYLPISYHRSDDGSCDGSGNDSCDSSGHCPWDKQHQYLLQKPYWTIDEHLVHRRTSTRNVVLSWAWRSTWASTSKTLNKLRWRLHHARLASWWRSRTITKIPRLHTPTDLSLPMTDCSQAHIPKPPSVQGYTPSTLVATENALLEVKDLHRTAIDLTLNHVLAAQHAFENRLPWGSTRHSTRCQTPTVYTLPLPEAPILLEWQAFAEILKEVVSAAPETTAIFILIWSYNLLGVRFEYAKQPCFRSISRLDPLAMMTISQHCMKWLS